MTQAAELAPEEYRVQRGARRRLIGHLAAGASILAIAMMISNAIRADTRRIWTDIQPLRAEEAEMLLWDGQVPLLTEEATQWKTRGQQLHELVHQPYWCGILEDLAGAAGERIRVDSMRILAETPDKKEAGKLPLRYQLQLAGEARSDVDVVSFLSALSSSPRIRELRLDQFSASGDSESTGTILFSMTGFVEQS